MDLVTYPGLENGHCWPLGGGGFAEFGDQVVVGFSECVVAFRVRIGDRVRVFVFVCCLTERGCGGVEGEVNDGTTQP